MKPRPLFTDNRSENYELELQESKEWLSSLVEHSFDFRKEYKYACQFLYTLGNKTETVKKYRAAVEKLLLWAWLVKKESCLSFKPRNIKAMVEFYESPPNDWVSESVARRFVKSGLQNTNWRPCVKSKKAGNTEASTKLLLAAASAFYLFLIQEDYAEDNPAVAARGGCVKGRTHTMNVSEKILSKTQMSYLFTASRNMPYEDSYYKARARFLIAVFYYRYKRISELSKRRDYKGNDFTPLMGHIVRKDQDWFLKIPEGTSKGFKQQLVTLPPELLNELKIFRTAISARASIELSALPLPGESTPLVPVILANGEIKGGLGDRMIRNIVNDVLSQAKTLMLEDSEDSADAEHLLYEANAIEEATTHWLRHTGVSADLESGRNIEHVRDDALHSTISTTNIYIHTDEQERAKSARTCIKPDFK